MQRAIAPTYEAATGKTHRAAPRFRQMSESAIKDRKWRAEEEMVEEKKRKR
jgi:hypothetical protein